MSVGAVTYRALLIGNSTFPNDPHNLQPLEGPVNDVLALQRALTDPDVGLLEPTSVRAVPERTMSEVLIELERFFGAASRDDVLLLYYSGHGLLDETNQLYLCARDSRADLMKATAVSARNVNAMIDGSRAQTTVIVLDCCYSGSFKSGQLPDSLRGNGRFLLTSCRSGQLANDATVQNHTSAFTQHLVNGLLEGASDSDGDGFVDLSDVYDYVYERLSREGRQLPQRNFAGGGDVVIARRTGAAPPPDGPGPGPAPELTLSQTTIDIRDVGRGEALATETVFVRHGGSDWEVHTEADWVTVHRRSTDSFAVELHPTPGVNRANVVVHEPSSGATATLRIRVGVTAGVDRRGRPPLQITPKALAGLGAGLVLVLVLVLTVWPDGGARFEVSVDVPSASGWIDSGIFVDDGETIDLEASGFIRHALGGTQVGPDGEEKLAGHPNNIVDEAGHGALVGRFGEDGEPFVVGSSWVYTSEGGDGGALWLTVNDTGTDNNSGHFRVSGTLE